jgi:cytochrome c553
MSSANDPPSRKGRVAQIWATSWLSGLRYSLVTLVVVSGIAGLLVSEFHFRSTSAQPRITLGDDAGELRTLYANAEDVAAGKRLAESSCAGCHGISGVSTSAGVPHLAGQRAAYLYLELKNYQAGVRGVTAMNNAVKFLSQDALFEVSAYFASLAPPQPSATNGAIAATLDPVQVGKTAAAGCAGCHGETGVSKTSGMPSLVGLDPKFLVAAMKAYKSGQRKNDLMKSMVANVSDATMDTIALYYGLQKAEKAQTPAPGDRAAGAGASAACAACHGAEGVGGSAAIPSIAGQDAQYLAVALQAYRQRSRAEETMKGIAASLDDDTIKNLSAYYAAQEPKQPNVRKPLTVDEWSQRCDRCHGVNGNSTSPRLPALAGQRLDYLEKVLHDYQTGARKSPQMAAMSDMLTDHDIDSLAAHYAAQKAGVVVYVIVPAR